MIWVSLYCQAAFSEMFSMTGSDVLMGLTAVALFITNQIMKGKKCKWMSASIERTRQIILLDGMFWVVSNFGFRSMSKHPTGAQMLREVGAVEFLTQLSPSVDPRLRTIVDGIFDQLFHLPEALPSCPPTTSYEPHSVPSLQTGIKTLHWFYIRLFCRLL